MKTVKCEISNYQNRIWILFDDKRKVKVGGQSYYTYWHNFAKSDYNLQHF
jgi:hypothetical protein